MSKYLPSWTVFPRFTQSFVWLALIGLIFLSPIAVGPATSQVLTADTSDRAGFSARMEKIDASCRPVGTSIIRDSYTYRLVMELGNECIGENLTVLNAAKYVSLIGVTAASMAVQAHPATAVLAAATVNQLKSDAAKCVVRALIDSSDEAADWKVKWKARAMAGFSAYEWRQFTKAMPSLADGGKLQAVGGAMRDGYGAWDRGTELGNFANLVAGAVQEGEDALNTFRHGATDTVLRRFKQQRTVCDYRAARSSLNQAYLTAQEECEAFAAEYSYLDTKHTDYIDQHYLTRNDFGEAREIVNNTIESYKNSAQSAANTLTEFSAVFETIEGLAKVLEADEHAVKQDQDEYLNQLGLTRRELDTPRACYAIGDLRSKLEKVSEGLSAECRRSFYRRLREDGVPLPDDVQAQMVNAAHLRVNKWWGQLDEIRHLYRDCNSQEGAAQASNLRREISGNPVMAAFGNDCGPVEQPHLLAALAGLKKPDYCENTTVPLGLVGAPLSSAYKVLDEAELFVDGNLVRVEPQEGQLPDTVIASDPASGATVRVWTGVKLTVVAAPPEVEMVNMPEVIGIEGEKAAKLVRGVGLDAVVVANGTADTLEKKPGFVYTATATAGDELPKETLVTLSTYKARPMIEVPAVAKLTPEKAKDVLRGAGFVATDISAGKPATTADQVGQVYGSNPPYMSKHPMFSPVSPLVYGPVKITLIPVPSVSDITPKAAGDILAAYGDHFVVGALALSPDRPEGSILGDVHFTDPPAGHPAPPGTVVTLFIYAPIEEEIGNLKLIPFEIIGLPADQAAGLLRGDDNFFAVPKPGDGDVAKAGQTPGTVQYSVPAAGTLALRGSAVLLRVFTAPPVTEDEPAVAEDSWIGVWKITEIRDQNGKQALGEMRLVISRRAGGLLVKVQPLKDGVYEKGMELPMVVDAHNTLRIDPKILEKIERESKTTPGKGGVLAEPFEKLAVVLKQIFETLEITREGSSCAYRVVDPKKGLMAAEFTCIRQ